MPNRLISVMRQSGWRIFAKGAFVIAFLVVIGYAANSVDFEETFKALPFSNSADAQWYQGPMGFLLLGTLLVCISCPRQIVSFFAAYFFGVWFGFLIAWMATVLACVAMYAVANSSKSYFERFVKGKVGFAINFWRENPLVATIIWRFLPAGSNFLTNLAAGAFGIPSLRFVVGSAIGYIPQTLIFAIIGSGVRVESELQILVSVGLFAISILLGLMLYDRYRKRIDPKT